jgi:hypothetical protein
MIKIILNCLLFSASLIFCDANDGQVKKIYKLYTFRSFYLKKFNFKILKNDSMSIQKPDYNITNTQKLLKIELQSNYYIHSFRIT